MSDLRLSRLLCFLLSFLLLCPSFLINVSAADEENLVNSNLSEWTVLLPEYTSIHPASSDLFLVRIYGDLVNEQRLYAGGAYDLTDSAITIGNEYTLSFYFPDPDRYVSSETGSASFAGNGSLSIGLASFVDGSPEFIEGYYYTINKDNFDKVKDSQIQFSFEMPSGVVNPCICFFYMNYVDGNNTVCFYLKDMKLVDESQAKEDNFFSRLFEWFEVKFKNISDSFTDLKDSFTSKINDLKESFQNKIDELKQSFVDLKNDLIEGIKGLFVPDDEFITQWKKDMEKMLSEHLGFIYQIPALTKDYVTQLQALLNDKSVYFNIPACEFDFNGFHFNLWKSQSVDFSFLTQAEKGTIWHTIYKEIYPVFLRLILYGMLIAYGRHEWKRVMNN